MEKHRVAIGRYRKKTKSLRRVVELSGAFDNLKGDEKVFLNLQFLDTNLLMCHIYPTMLKN